MISYGNVWNVDGKSTDEKPVGDEVPNGSRFNEMDTSFLYVYDADTKTWIAQSSICSGGGSGVPGKDGVGISSVKQTVTSSESGGINVITITLTNGSQWQFEVMNGVNGQDGFSPYISENADNTSSVYKLDVTNKDGFFTTPNLLSGSGAGTGNVYSEDIDYIKKISKAEYDSLPQPRPKNISYYVIG